MPPIPPRLATPRLATPPLLATMPRPRPPGAAALAAALGGLAFSAAGVRAASSTAPIPACGYAVVASTGGKCKFAKAPDNKDQAQAEA